MDGHPLAQANWYAFGRLAWDHTLTSEQIADEWVRLTYGSDPKVVARRFEKYRETVPEVVAAWQAMGLPLRRVDNRGSVSALRKAAAGIAAEIEAR